MATGYIPGHGRNRFGARRTTVTVPDEVAVERFVAGRPVALATVDRDAAIDRLDARGLSAAAIARQLGVCNKTVHRRRAARRAGAR